MIQDDPFGKEPYASVALEKIKPKSANFRIYCVGWLETGGPPSTWDTLEVTGAEFRAAKSGPNKGRLTIIVPNTKRIAHVHQSEFMEANRGA